MRILLLAISLSLKSWGVVASEPESESEKWDSKNVIDFRFELIRERNAYPPIQGEMISPTQSQWSDIRKGCDPLELRGILARGTGREFVAMEWLRKNAMQCSRADLIYVANNVQDWSDFAMYDAIRLANYYALQN